MRIASQENVQKRHLNLQKDVNIIRITNKNYKLSDFTNRLLKFPSKYEKFRGKVTIDFAERNCSAARS